MKLIEGTLNTLMPNAPRVVAVVVVHDPGTWFQEMLDSLRDSDYPNLSVIFVDTSSEVDVTDAIHAALPAASVVKAESDLGFAGACNKGANQASRATHLLFCHDDVAFAPDAIRKMVEEAFLMNAGVVTPKYVVWNSPSQMLALGAAMDRTGSVASRVDVGDLDQGQYDVSQEVFVAPGGATLIRKDLFQAIKGFDDKMFLYYEDVDLSWRAQIAGARIVAAPLARVRHLSVSTLGARRSRGGRRKKNTMVRARLPRHDRLRYARKNQLRALLANARGFTRFVSIIEYLVLTIFEALYFLLTGKPKIAFSIVESWLGIATKRQSLRRKRKSILSYQVKSDVELRNQMVRGSARIKGFINSRKNFRSSAEEARRISAWHDYSSEKSLLDRLTKPSFKQSKDSGRFDEASSITIAFARISRGFMWLMVGFVLVGTRHLSIGNIPLVGQFLPFGPAHTLLATYFSGPSNHHGPISPSPTSDLLLGVIGYVFLGGTGVEAHFIFMALIAMGLAGVFRIVADFRNRTAAYAAVGIYAIGPILGGVVSSASFGGIVVYGLAPWFLIRVLRLSNFPGIVKSSRLSTVYELTVEGIWLGLIFAFAPSFLFIFVLLILTILIVGNFLGYLGSIKRYLAVQIAAFCIALALNSPWIFTFFVPGARSPALFGSAGPAHVGIQWLLLLRVSQTARVAPLFGLYLVALIASVVFVAGRKADGVLTLFAIFCVTQVVAVFSSYGGFGTDPISLELVLPVAFLSAVIAIGSGIEAAFTVLPTLKIGWRHSIAFLTAASILIASYSMLGQNTSGRYQLGAQGYESSLGWMVPNSRSNPGKVLWLGRLGTVPGGSYQISSDMAAGVAGIGNPTVESLFSPANPGLDALAINAVNAAVRENTVYIGKPLANLGIKYVVIPQSSLSSPSFLTSDLNLMLSRQRDLNQLVADPSVVAFSVQDPLKVPGPTHLSPFNALLNFLRLIIGIVVAAFWLGLVEASLSRRSVALWITRRFFATPLGQTLVTIGRLFRWSVNSKNVSKLGKGWGGRRKSIKSTLSELPPQRAGSINEFKHIKITSSENRVEDRSSDARVTNGED
ncbi:MAG: glycosyltransferase [Acidimicrobiaceae bacterium]|nr:glycosyltransferase [Acidimicrobiaceae bacterium]